MNALKKLFIFSFVPVTFCFTAIAEDIESVVENRTTIAPLVYVTSKYPESAYRDGIEGYCRVSYDIEVGSVSRPKNIKIKNCEPESVFEESCKEAVSHWIFIVESTSESPEGLVSTCRYTTD